MANGASRLKVLRSDKCPSRVQWPASEEFMIRIICAMCVVCMTVDVARADWAPKTPAMKVAVVPFDVQGEAGHEWLGRAIQEGLATELSGAPGMAGVIVPGV